MSQTATEILAILNITETATVKETLVDSAVDKLNRYGAPSISNMTGTAGAKTITLTSKQRDAVVDVARILYNSYYKNAAGIQSTSVSVLNQTNMDLMSNPTVLESIKYIAQCLRDDGELPYLIFTEYDMEEE